MRSRVKIIFAEKRRISLFGKVLLIIFGIVLGVLFAELCIRLLVKQRIIDIDTQIISDTRIFSSQLGYINKPYSSRLHNLGKYRTTWNINKYGFRDFDYPTKKLLESRRILALGDSMMFGMGVESSESLPKILETKVNRSTESAHLTEVLNMGVLGYGPLEYQKLYSGLGKKFKPDIVVVGFFLGNDSLDSLWVNLNKKYIFLKSLPDELVAFRVNQWLKENSRLWILLLDKYYSWVETQNVDTLKLVFNNDVKGQMLRQVQIDPSSGYMRKSWKLTDDALSKLVFEATKNNTNVVFVVFPTKEQIIPDEWKKVKEGGHDVDERLYSNSGARREMLSLCKTNSWDCLDLQEIMRKQETPGSLFVEDDFHLSRLGNEVAADALINFLSEKNLLEY